MSTDTPEQPPRSASDSFAFVAPVTLALVALIVAFAALFLPSRGTAEEDGAPAGGGGTETVDVTLGDLFVKPASIDVAAGTKIVFNVENTGKLQHDFKLDGKDGTALLDPGAKETVELGPFDESMQLWCTVPGHKDAGMVFDVNVSGRAGDGDGAAGAQNAVIDFNAEPAADWRPYDPKLAPAPGGTEHKVTFTAIESVLEVAPGVTQEMWSFNGTVPGPVLRGKVGDIFTITLKNEGKLGHSIDFHASKVAWNDEMRTIQPGESLVYQFEAKHAGIFMYHCGTAPVLHHIGNGMYGALIVDPPDLAPVDKEFVLVQSELYPGPMGGPGDLAKMASDQWDAVVFNGYVNQYKFAPFTIGSKDRIRIWVLDAGPSENSSFHVVGTIFDTVFKEGTYLLRPGPGRGGAQALDLQPAQGGFVEMTFDEDGLYLMVTHKFSNVGRGALGIIQVGEVDTSGGASH